MANVISVSVLGDVKDISRKMGSIEKQIGGLGQKFQSAGKLIAGAFIAAGGIALFKDIITGASEAQQTLGATEAIFGKYASTVVKTSDQAASAFGLSATEYRTNANQLGAVLSNLGVSQGDLAGKTQELIGKGADLAATFGGTTKSSVEALTAAYKGEYEQLERYGVSIKAADVSTLLAARGQSKLTGAAKKAAEQQAVTDLITKQTAKSTGAFAKESNTLAGQQQRLAAKVENVKDKLGMVLLPILTSVATFVSDTVVPKFEAFAQWFTNVGWPAIQRFAGAIKDNLQPAVQAIGEFLTGTLVPKLQELVQAFKDNQAWIMPIVVGLTTLVAAYKTYQAIIAIGQAVTKGFAIAQAALNVVLSANPIALVVIAIIALIAALVYAYKTNETFRKVVDAAWQWMKNTVSAVIKWFTTAIPAAWQWIKNVTSSVWNGIKGFFSTVWNGIKSAFSTGLNGIKSAWEAAWNAVKTFLGRIWEGIKSGVTTGITNVMTAIGGIKGKVTGALSAAGSWLIQTGRNLLQGLIDGVKQMAGRLVSAVTGPISDAIGKAKGLLGIKSPSRVFKNIGKQVGEGLIIGLDAMSRKVEQASTGLAGTVTTGFGTPKLSLSASGAGASGGSVTFNINVPPTADKASIGREIQSALDEWQRVNG